MELAILGQGGSSGTDTLQSHEVDLSNSLRIEMCQQRKHNLLFLCKQIAILRAFFWL